MADRTPQDITRSRALLRLRLAAEGSRARVIVVNREDALALLEAHQPSGVGAPVKVSAASATPSRPRAGGHVALSADIESARRLARAAWDTADGPDERVARYGHFDDTEPGLQWGTIQAALRCLQRLVGTR